MITPPPDHYDGLLGAYLDRYVVPNLPPRERLEAWVRAVLDTYATDDPICIVRGPRKGELARRSGAQIVHSDNSPGIWCYLRALDGAFDPRHLPGALERGEIPVLAMLKGRGKRDWEWNYAPKALSKKDSARLWSLDLKHCHIFPVKEGGTLTPRQRGMRNLCPANHFLFPNGHGGTRWITERQGWNDHQNHGDLGESARVIAWVAHRIARHLGPHSAYPDFCDAVGATLPPQPPDARILIRRPPAKASQPRVRPSDLLATRICPTCRRSVPRARLDHHVRTRHGPSAPSTSRPTHASATSGRSSPRGTHSGLRRGHTYTREQIRDLVGGGGLQTYLPTVQGRVVCACLRLDTNPDAPRVLLPGFGVRRQSSAESLRSAREAIPVFLKRAIGAWEYVGHHRAFARRPTPDEIREHARRAGRTGEVATVVWMELVSAR